MANIKDPAARALVDEIEDLTEELEHARQRANRWHPALGWDVDGMVQR